MIGNPRVALGLAVLALVAGCGSDPKPVETQVDPVVILYPSVAQAAARSDVVVVGHVTRTIGREGISTLPDDPPPGLPGVDVPYVYYEVAVDRVLGGKLADPTRTAVAWLDDDGEKYNGGVAVHQPSGEMIFFLVCHDASYYPRVTLVTGELCYPPGDYDSASMDVTGETATARSVYLSSLAPQDQDAIDDPGPALVTTVDKVAATVARHLGEEKRGTFFPESRD